MGTIYDYLYCVMDKILELDLNKRKIQENSLFLIIQTDHLHR